MNMDCSYSITPKPNVTSGGIITSPDKEPLAQALLNIFLPRGVELPSGVRFVAKLDSITGLYSIPSHKINFGGIKVSNIIANIGCRGCLLSIQDETELRNIFELHPAKEYFFKVGGGVGTAGASYTLLVKPKSDRKRFQIFIGKDRFGESAASTVSVLRFSLSSEMCLLILNDDTLRSRFTFDDEKLLQEQSARGIPPMPLSLLGNKILNEYEFFKCQDIIFFCEITDLPDSFLQTLPDLARGISSALADPDSESRTALNAYADYLEAQVDTEYDL